MITLCKYLKIKKNLINILILFAITVSTQAQSNISGLVINKYGSPVEGANIISTESHNGTISNKEGQFSLGNIIPGESIIKVSAIGYNTIFDTITHNDTLITIHLQKSPITLEEVNVENNRQKAIKLNTSLQAEIISQGYIEQNNAGSLMQSLSKIPGINSISIGSGFSKPVIRGLSYYRVVFAEYGIKREEQQWSNHNGLSVDQNNIENLEIIFGPGALEYGSDAIGGIINILPDNIPESGKISGEITLNGQTNTQWYGVSGKLGARKNKLFTIASFTYNNFGDFTIPGTHYYLLPTPATSVEGSHKIEIGNRVYNTAGREQAFKLETGYVGKTVNNRLIFEYHSNKNGFFDYSGIQYDSIKEIQDNSYRDILLPFQEIDDYSISNLLRMDHHNNQITVNAGWQLNISDEFSNLTDRTGNRYADLIYFRNMDNLSVSLNLQTLTLSGKYCINNIANHQISFGLSGQYQTQSINGYDHILPPYNRLDAGIFITDRWKLNKKLHFHYGLRFDNYSINIEESLNPDPSYGDSIFNEAQSKVYQGEVISAGLIYENKQTTLKLNFGNSYRIPSIYELSAYGLHRHDIKFEIGDINLDPEQAWQMDISASRQYKSLFLSISPFVYYFTNYIYLYPTSELRPEGQVWQYRQDKALLTGGEFTVNYQYKNTTVNLGAEYVYAVNLNLITALPSTPPASATIEISQSFMDNKLFTNNIISVNTTLAAAQKYTVINELQTPDYVVFGLKAQTTLNISGYKLKTLIIVDNLLNNKYFNHLSIYRRLRIPEPGRNIQILLTIPI